MKHLVIACSLSPSSRSALLAERLAGCLASQGEEGELVDLRSFPLPLCDADASGSDPQVVDLAGRVAAAASVTLAVPIYNFDVGGAARNLVAVLGSAWRNKIVGFLCAAGGRASYMAVMALASSLMLDFRCLVLPRFVYATRGDFAGDEVTDPTLVARLEGLARDLRHVSRSLASGGAVDWPS